MASIADIHAQIDAVWRMESAKLIAALTRRTRDVGLAEDLAQDALLIALKQWPEQGIPQKPGAWLMATAKHRALDHFRRTTMQDRKREELAREFAEAEQVVPDLAAKIDETIEDDLLRLIFIACHPVLPVESRIALTLRLLGGLTTEEIARAFLMPVPTIAQRIVRAKRTLAEKKVPFEIPVGDALSERLAAVLAVIYLIFNEGHSATAGEDWIRPALCEEAMRLGRVLVGLAPSEPEAHALCALMEIQASRLKARTSSSGEPILLLDQNRAVWDQILITHGLLALNRAEALSSQRGTYTLQAALAACHARVRRPEETDWRRIVALYEELNRIVPSLVIRLNQAVAVSMADGPVAGLKLIDALMSEPALKTYHLLFAARGDILLKLDRKLEAQKMFRQAAALTQNAQEQKFLRRRAEL